MLIKSVQFIDKYLSNSGAPVIVGVSGGPDSLVLLHLLHAAQKSLIVGYLDHGLRDTAGDLQVVSAAAASIRAEFHQRYVDVAAQSSETGKTIEEAGREARYQFLFELAEQSGAQAVAVGHTADDQVETVLMHLLRGAGPSGLQGMQAYSQPNPWSSKVPLVRPLLAVWREEILAYIHEYQLLPSEDLSNLEQKYFRNRIRHDLIPYLENFNPQIKLALWRTAEIIKDDYALLDQSFQHAWETALITASPGQQRLVRFDRNIFLNFPTAVQRAVLRIGIQCLRSDLRDIKFDWIELGRDFIAAPGQSNHIEIGVGLEIYKSANEIWLFVGEIPFSIPEWPLLDTNMELQLNIPGCTDLPGGWQFESRWLMPQDIPMEKIQSNQDRYQAWLQPQAASPSLTIRTRKRGDRIKPLGMSGRTIKLANFMINVHLPQPVRARWPVVCLEDRIVWLPGYCVAEAVRVKNRSAPILWVSLTRGAQEAQT